MWRFPDGEGEGGSESAGPPPTILSSLGVVDGILDLGSEKGGEGEERAEIREFEFGLDVKGPVLVIYAWCWRGRVRLCCAWDRRFFEEGFVDGLLRGIKEEVAKGLEVGVDVEVEEA